MKSSISYSKKLLAFPQLIIKKSEPGKLSVCFLSLLMYVCLYVLDPTYQLEMLVDESKCPACLGHNLSCQFMDVHRISYGHVYFGTLSGHEVVAKAIKHEQDKCDEIVSYFKEYNCHDRMLYRQLEGSNNFRKLDSKLLKKFNLCSSTRLYNKLSSSEFYSLFFDYSLFLNSKSKILGCDEIFPKIVASCPQVAVFKNMGKPLRSFLKSGLLSRYRICYEALKFAEVFSKTKEGFILYMTDTGLDNLVWTSDGKVIPVDLDDIVVVDTHEVQLPDEFYNHEHEDCPGDCVKYVPQTLCKYGGGDMNYYLMCKYVVNKLIFYDADEDLLDILAKCVSEGIGRKRELHVKELKAALLYRLSHTGIPIELNFMTSEIRGGY